MKVSTIEAIPGSEITEVLGIAKGNTIRAKHLGKDIVAGWRNMVGGELLEYTKLMDEAREEAYDRMVENARSMGADAVVGMRFATSMISQGGAEILAFGTAVRLKDGG